MKAILINEVGGSDKLRYENVSVPVPKHGELLIKNHAIGINFIDTYHRSGLYKLPLPAILGREGAGVVEAIGEGVNDFKIGERVAYVLNPNSYADYVVSPSWRAIKIPETVSFNVSLNYWLKFNILNHIVDSSICNASRNDCTLFSMFYLPIKTWWFSFSISCCWRYWSTIITNCKIKRAHVIATTSSHEKAEIIKKLGADEVIITSEKKIDEEVKRLTNGKGVKVAYDGVGAATWQQSLNSLSPLGYLVLFGNASGPVPPFDPLLLSEKGSLFVTRPTLYNYASTPEEYISRAKDLFSWLGSKLLKVNEPTTFPLSAAAKAQELLESGKSTGKLILIPEGTN